MIVDPGADPLAAIGALAEPMRRRLYELVAAADVPLGRDDAAAALGIGRPLAAFHLDRLVRAGLLEAEYRRRGERRGPGAGRPAKFYRRAAGTIQASLPTRRYELAAGFFAGGLERGDGSGVAAALDEARAFGREAGEHALRVERSRSAGPAADAASRAPSAATSATVTPSAVGSAAGVREPLEAALAEFGFQPRRDPETDVITLGSCPFDAMAAAHRSITCAMNRALLEGFCDGLGSHRAVESSTVPGRCCVAFRPPVPEPAPGR
ncbi:MAG: helix-turn-helix transcriptional regulator [Candidatus Limnocylindrales bacterium]